MKTITYSAPGKVILSGEHAVVYGKPAFVTAINLRLSVIVKSTGTNQDKKLDEVIHAVNVFLRSNRLTPKDSSCSLEVLSDIPVGRGLGSSAALSVAASAALLEFFTGQAPQPETVNNCAYAVEKLFHNRPSGVDTTASCFGGLIFYRREFDFLKTLSKLHMQIPKTFASRMFLIDSGKPDESTAAMVGLVGKRYNRDAKKTEVALGRIEKFTKQFVVACMAEDRNLLHRCINDNERELDGLGIVSRHTRALLKKLNSFGSGKVTGAGGKKGGSGYLLFFAHDAVATKAFLDKNTISYLPFSPSQVGVRKEL